MKAAVTFEKWVSCVLVGGSFHWGKLQGFGGRNWLVDSPGHPSSTSCGSQPGQASRGGINIGGSEG